MNTNWLSIAHIQFVYVSSANAKGVKKEDTGLRIARTFCNGKQQKKRISLQPGSYITSTSGRTELFAHKLCSRGFRHSPWKSHTSKHRTIPFAKKNNEFTNKVQEIWRNLSVPGQKLSWSHYRGRLQGVEMNLKEYVVIKRLSLTETVAGCPHRTGLCPPQFVECMATAGSSWFDNTLEETAVWMRSMSAHPPKGKSLELTCFTIHKGME